MNSVFMKYKVNDDVADMIAKKLHMSYQKKLNDEIHVMVGGDVSFDYLLFNKFRSNNLFFPYDIPSGEITSRSRGEINYAMHHLHVLLSLNKENTENMSKKITQKEYSMYILSNKQVFRLDRPVRWQNLLSSLQERIENYKGQQYHVHPALPNTLDRGLADLTKQINHNYHIEVDRVEKKHISKKNALEYWMSFPVKKKNLILKKDLINYLVANGHSFKSYAFKFTKAELWDLVMKLE